ncbi:hypothetical protein A4D02_05710 [Niastella koreensis]|uniref:Lipoprotein n=2 Tax=Niastella koreensis TaxID=354356 RepID=G8TDN7_NIAKG|nr:hypothetical protein [Niastella koreensis]AEW01487.1 hypothetical protein Niako_5250 [Niastella koreensis GR20-10]OQP48214.1 hypothetical protein A4D02_05710 [Niastella koreensis]
MKRIIISTLIILSVFSCSKDHPVDGDGLLITTRQECYVSNFELLGADYVTVLTKQPVIDTTAQTVNVTVQFGTDLKNLFPQFTLATDCKLDPKIVGKVDFSDLANPKQYTVISGNRQISKTYQVLITVQPR